MKDDVREFLEKCYFHNLKCNEASMLALYQLLTNSFYRSKIACFTSVVD